MRLCGYMWRWPYSPAEGVMLLLGLSLARSVSAQLTCQAAEAAQNLTQPHYNNTANKNTNADFLMPFVQSFLYTVQPHPFPEESLNTSDRLDKLNSSLVQLQSSIYRIQANVTAVRHQINQTLSEPGHLKQEGSKHPVLRNGLRNHTTSDAD
ncbi:hypothetical protein XENOCAPTIV_004991 [Xenoophorus captivus]|uniref:Uncharacterized protein n=1 Tax=Xenoophorus captivus TaxID=1517983 RepID=A0ABV0SG27_9TELE